MHPIDAGKKLVCDARSGYTLTQADVPLRQIPVGHDRTLAGILARVRLTPAQSIFAAMMKLFSRRPIISAETALTKRLRTSATAWLWASARVRLPWKTSASVLHPLFVHQRDVAAVDQREMRSKATATLHRNAARSAGGLPRAPCDRRAKNPSARSAKRPRCDAPLEASRARYTSVSEAHHAHGVRARTKARNVTPANAVDRQCCDAKA